MSKEDFDTGVNLDAYMAMQKLSEQFILIPRNMDNQEGIDNGQYDEHAFAEEVLRPLVTALAEACQSRDIPFVLSIQTAVMAEGSKNVTACNINPDKRYLGTVMRQFSILKQVHDDDRNGHDIH